MFVYFATDMLVFSDQIFPDFPLIQLKFPDISLPFC